MITPPPPKSPLPCLVPPWSWLCLRAAIQVPKQTSPGSPLGSLPHRKCSNITSPFIWRWRPLNAPRGPGAVSMALGCLQFGSSGSYQDQRQLTGTESTGLLPQNVQNKVNCHGPSPSYVSFKHVIFRVHFFIVVIYHTSYSKVCIEISC